jgi:myo-inositol-1(or 4)-monophosphatase
VRSREATALLLGAERAVELGAQIARAGRHHVAGIVPKGDRDFATAIDLEVEAVIRAQLERLSPAIGFLGEEEPGARLEPVGRQWVLDPIDGTVNYAHDSPLCAISLALLEDGRPLLGIVDLPLLGERYTALAGAGASYNGARIALAPVERLADAIVGVADFAVGALAEQENPIHFELVRRLARSSLRVRAHGSAALDLAWLARGRLGASIMLSNLPWDVSAGVLIAREAGAEVYDHDGSPYGPRASFTIASTPAVRVELLPLLRESINAAARV